MSAAKPCPECGSYRYLPRCSDPACQARRCSRPQCGYEEGTCELHDADPSPWDLEKVEGVSKARFKPVTGYGRFIPGIA